MSKKFKKFYQPVIDCTASAFVFTSPEKALKEAQKMFRRKEFTYLKGLPQYKNFRTAIENDVIYIESYELKE